MNQLKASAIIWKQLIEEEEKTVMECSLKPNSVPINISINVKGCRSYNPYSCTKFNSFE